MIHLDLLTKNKSPQKTYHTLKSAECSLRAKISIYKNSATSTPCYASIIESIEAICSVCFSKGQNNKRGFSP